MAVLSVIRRGALRDQMSIREIARRTGLSRNTIRMSLRWGLLSPGFRPRSVRASWTLARRSILHRLPRQRASPASGGGGSSSCMRIRRFLALPVRMGGWRPSRGQGARNASAFSNRQAAGHLFLWRSSRAKPSNWTGAKTGRSLVVSAPSSRLPASSCRTAGHSWSGPIFCKPTRCCLTRTGMCSGSLAACPGAGFPPPALAACGSAPTGAIRQGAPAASVRRPSAMTGGTNSGLGMPASSTTAICAGAPNGH